MGRGGIGRVPGAKSHLWLRRPGRISRQARILRLKAELLMNIRASVHSHRGELFGQMFFSPSFTCFFLRRCNRSSIPVWAHRYTPIPVPAVFVKMSVHPEKRFGKNP